MKRIVCAILSLLVVTGGAVAQDITPPQSYPQEFLDYVGEGLNSETVSSTHELVGHFCTLTLEGGSWYDSDETHYYYDPTQSLFMMILCNQQDKANIYLQHVSLDHYGVQCDGFTQDGDDCQKPLYEAVHNIYDAIVGDMFDVMTAQAYGYDTYTQSGTDKTIEIMSYEFLVKHGHQRGESACNENDEVDCIIPETVHRLEGYINQAEKLSQKLVWLRNSIDTQEEGAALCTSSDKKTGMYTILNCGLGIGTPTLPTNTDQHNMVANELLWYTTFTKYYGYELQNNTTIHPSQRVGVEKIPMQGAQYEAMLHEHQQAGVRASRASLMHINQISSTFPTHIHLLAQYEMIKKVRARLAEMYTPLHQLYYKLRNVQAQGS